MNSWISAVLNLSKEEYNKSFDGLTKLQDNVYFAVKSGCFSEWDNGRFVAEYAQYPSAQYKNQLRIAQENIEKEKQQKDEERIQAYLAWQDQHIKEREVFSAKFADFNKVYFNGTLNGKLSADENAKLKLQYPKGKLISLSFYSVIRYEFLNVLGTDANNKKIAASGVQYYETKFAAGEAMEDISVSTKYRQIQDQRIKVVIALVDKVLEIANNEAELKAYEKKLKKLNAGGIGEGSYTGVFKILGITL